MWQTEIPTEEGLWWFYGELWTPIGRPNPELEVVEVQKISNEYAYVSHGEFVSKDEGMQGVWVKMLLPKIPSEFKYHFSEQLYRCTSKCCVAAGKFGTLMMWKLKKLNGKLYCPYCPSPVEPTIDELSEFPKE